MPSTVRVLYIHYKNLCNAQKLKKALCDSDGSLFIAEKTRIYKN